MQNRIPARAIWALGLTQILGYGTLYYSFGVLAPAIGREFGWSPEWVYGALTIALLAGGLSAPVAGHLADRFGAARTMAVGSVVVAATLVALAIAPNGPAFAVALVAMEITAGLVLYATAFAALVQASGQEGQRSITHLTLIAGFASTLFWPLTSLLLTQVDWRSVYLIFAGLNLLCCAPLHFWLSRLPRQAAALPGPDDAVATKPAAGALSGRHRSVGFGLMMLGFAIEGFILSAILMQIIPLLTGLGLGGGALLVTSLFGPAQVLSRLGTMVLGRNQPAARVALTAAVLLPLGALVLAVTAPMLPGAVLFAVLFGLGSGLLSIVSGSLPLELLGRENYGSRLGWLSSARQTASAVAPFCLALLMGVFGAVGALWAIAALGLVAILTFLVIALMPGFSAAAETAPAL